MTKTFITLFFLFFISPTNAQLNSKGKVLPLRSSKKDLILKAFINKPSKNEVAQEDPFYLTDEAGSNHGTKLEGQEETTSSPSNSSNSNTSSGGDPGVTSNRSASSVNFDNGKLSVGNKNKNIKLNLGVGKNLKFNIP